MATTPTRSLLWGERHGEESARLTVSVSKWGGWVAEDMSPGKHCENVTATLTAGQFSKSDTAGHFPLCVGTMSQGGRAGVGGGTRLRSQRDVFIK